MIKASISISVRGVPPASKGSYRAVWGRGRSGGRVTRLIPMDAKERPWRQLIASTIRYRGTKPLIGRDCRVMMDEVYYLRRPSSVSYEQRQEPTVKPDIDKLQRALHDALTDSRLIADDSIITTVKATKMYVDSMDDTGVEAVITWESNK